MRREGVHRRGRVGPAPWPPRLPPPLPAALVQLLAPQHGHLRRALAQAGLQVRERAEGEEIHEGEVVGRVRAAPPEGGEVVPPRVRKRVVIDVALLPPRLLERLSRRAGRGLPVPQDDGRVVERHRPLPQAVEKNAPRERRQSVLGSAVRVRAAAAPPPLQQLLQQLEVAAHQIALLYLQRHQRVRRRRGVGRRRPQRRREAEHRRRRDGEEGQTRQQPQWHPAGRRGHRRRLGSEAARGVRGRRARRARGAAPGQRGWNDVV
ncbi:hypothetical protein STCU_10608 [Strigomonas culicis]|uniref:Uncharacterized protein n=1 Tax=Strigomonas culicis TaxID=28005 RepID=S9V3K7_9TRYP|nr:hypothetical protein STCU_10608 [Strigomonas culicis]|eukprot:EPY17445.1 hypothetical protein STCU_10608 [Strigomonas culicis]